MYVCVRERESETVRVRRTGGGGMIGIRCCAHSFRNQNARVLISHVHHEGRSACMALLRFSMVHVLQLGHDDMNDATAF